MTKFRFHNKTKKGVAALVVAAILATVMLFTACPNSAGGGGGGGSGGIEGVWKALSATTVVGGVPTTGNFPVHWEDPDDENNHNATMQMYLCFYEGKMYTAVKLSGMSNSANDGLFQQNQGVPYSLSGNTLSAGGTTYIVNFPSAGRLEFTSFESGASGTYLFEKTSNYTAEQIKNAPPEP